MPDIINWWLFVPVSCLVALAIWAAFTFWDKPND